MAVRWFIRHILIEIYCKNEKNGNPANVVLLLNCFLNVVYRVFCNAATLEKRKVKLQSVTLELRRNHLVDWLAINP